MPDSNVPALVRGLYAITPDTLPWPELRAKCADALVAGARALQYRRKHLAAPDAAREAQQLASLCRDEGALFIVNDAPALAAAVGAHGVHIGRDDGSVGDARRSVGAGRVVGASAYNDLSRAVSLYREGADYVAFGSFFPSRVKPGAVRAETSLLERAKREMACPLVAIGGITLDNAPALIRAGADAVAVISDLFEAPDVAERAGAFAALFVGNVDP